MSQNSEPAPSVLYVVGTPIGHLGDLSPRAESLLAKASIIACEDTRYSGKLLKRIEAKGHRISFHKHNFRSRIPKLINLLEEGKSIAIISDAGLPGICDPGQELVAEARKNNHQVICIPGPCAATTALVSSGLPSSQFCFEGFLPPKGKHRRKRLKSIALEERTTIIYESPHRLIQLLKELHELCDECRPIQVAKELTKVHEEQIGHNLKLVLQHFLDNKPQGEFTLVLGGYKDNSEPLTDKKQLKSELNKLIRDGLSPTEAAKKLAEEIGESKRVLYSLIHEENKFSNND